MVASPVTIFTPKNMSFLFNRQSLDTRTSHDFSSLAYKRKTYYCQPTRMDQPITSFKSLIFPFIATHWILKHFIIGQGLPLQDRFCVNIPTILRARGH